RRTQENHGWSAAQERSSRNPPESGAEDRERRHLAKIRAAEKRAVPLFWDGGQPRTKVTARKSLSGGGGSWSGGPLRRSAQGTRREKGPYPYIRDGGRPRAKLTARKSQSGDGDGGDPVKIRTGSPPETGLSACVTPRCSMRRRAGAAARWPDSSLRGNPRLRP